MSQCNRKNACIVSPLKSGHLSNWVRDTAWIKLALLVQVHAHGILSFREPFNQSIPMSFPLNTTGPLIAPFWDTVDLSLGGEVWYRGEYHYEILRRVRDKISGAFDGDFYPNSLFIATWDKVASPDESFASQFVSYADY